MAGAARRFAACRGKTGDWRQSTDVMQWRFHTTTDHEGDGHGNGSAGRLDARLAVVGRTCGSHTRPADGAHVTPPRRAASTLRIACSNACKRSPARRLAGKRGVCASGTGRHSGPDRKWWRSCCAVDFGACASAIRSRQSAGFISADSWRPSKRLSRSLRSCAARTMQAACLRRTRAIALPLPARSAMADLPCLNGHSRGALRPDQLGPDAVPVFRAQVPATHQAIGGVLDLGRNIGWHRTPTGGHLVKIGRRNADPTSEILCAPALFQVVMQFHAPHLSSVCYHCKAAFAIVACAIVSR